MPLAALSLFITGTYTVTRPGAGARVLGRWVPAAGTTFPIDACIQPLNDKEVRLLPEGFTIDGSKKLYTTTLLRPGSTSAESDTLVVKSETWRVIAVQDVEGWESNGYYKAIIAKVDSP